MEQPAAERAIDELASRQHGLVNRRQLTNAGLTRGQIRRRVSGARLNEIAEDVFRVAGSPMTAAQRVLAAVLEFGSSAVASHTTAAALWELPGYLPDPIHVTAGRGRSRRRVEHIGVRHEPRCLEAEHLVEADGIPLTTPARTLFDLAGMGRLHPKKVERTLDTVLARRLSSMAALRLMLDRLGCRGRPGITLMRQFIADRGADYVPTESGLEFRFAELLQLAGVPRFRRQVDVGDVSWIGRVDFVHPFLPIVVEVDSALHHSSLTDRSRDRSRHERLEVMGWIVLSVSDVDVFHRGAEVVSRVRRAIAAAGAAA